MSSGRLWGWFGLSYASWLTIPRVLMHEMPEDWQNRMADLLEEYEQEFPGLHKMPNSVCSARQGRSFVKWPQWLLNYRHPDLSEINELRKP